MRYTLLVLAVLGLAYANPAQSSDDKTKLQTPSDKLHVHKTVRRQLDIHPRQEDEDDDSNEEGDGSESKNQGATQRAACECGKVPFDIPVGQESTFNSRPWTAAIVRNGIVEASNGKPHCAGVLINDRYVLTSASCMDGMSPDSMQVWLTALNSLQNQETDVGTAKSSMAQVIMHPNYDRTSKENDLALVKIDQHLNLTSGNFFSPVCVSSASTDYSGRYGTIFNWANARSKRVCTAEMRIMENSICKRASTGAAITGYMMCAGHESSSPVNADCTSNAGGPLTVLIDGKASLVGITSSGYDPTRAYSPSVFTRVSGYSDWILDNSQDANWCGS